MNYDHKKSLKELFRHCLNTTGASRLLNIARRRRGAKVGHLGKGHADAFAGIYESGDWVEAAGQESLSGAGSTLAATSFMTARLSQVLTDFALQRIVDIGCGDFNWMKNVVGERKYVGIDVVPKVVEENNRRYGSPTRRFLVGDAIEGDIPSGDVAICREVLFHLSFEHIRGVLANIARSDVKYVVLTTNPKLWFNSNIKSGDFRELNLQKRPFRLPVPRLVIADDKVAPGRALGLWERVQLLSVVS